MICKILLFPTCLSLLFSVTQDDEAAIKDVGLTYGEQMCRQLMALGAPGLHFYTLNLEKVRPLHM